MEKCTVFREDAVSINHTYMENMANLGLFAIHKIVLENTQKEFKRTWRRLLNTLRDTKLSLSRYIMVQHEMFCISLLSKQIGLD